MDTAGGLFFHAAFLFAAQQGGGVFVELFLLGARFAAVFALDVLAFQRGV